jgi:four helix bundle protein
MAKTFETLRVWHDARRLCCQVYELVRAKQFCRDLALADQLRRSAVSVMSNIAEGFERGGRAEFPRFLIIAKGSLAELRSQLYVAQDAAYATHARASELRQLCVVLSRQLDALIRRIKS